MNNRFLRFYSLFLIMLVAGMLNYGCRQAPKVTFSGAIPPEGAETFSVENFFNDANDGPANLEIRFSEALREYFQRNTPLTPVTFNGDIQLSGSISRYELRPVSAGAGETQGAQLQRLTIGVKYDYIVLTEEDKNLENATASQFQDFPADQNLSDVEDGLIEEIFEQIIFDIYNRTLADW